MTSVITTIASEPESGRVPEPMGLDVAQWSQQLHISNFANAYAEYRDVTSLGDISRILVIGPGQGLDCAVFRWRGYHVTTLDIDDRLKPDFVGSAHDLSMFDEKSFDVVIASHVLEHLPPAYLDRAIAELARVAHHALIYLPVGGRITRFRIMPGLFGWDWTVALHLCNPFNRPDPDKQRFCEGEHYWEIGRPGYSRRKVAARFTPYFRIRSMYWNPDWIMSFNFVLSAR